MERKYLQWFVLLAVLLLAFALTGCDKTEEMEKETEISVNTAKAAARDISRSVSYAGVVKGINETNVVAKIPARVTGVYVKTGDRVSAGQVMFALDSSDYSAGIEQAQVGRRAAELNLATATTNLERTKQLFEAGAVSKQQMEGAQTAFDSAEVGLAQADAAINMASVQLNNCSVTAPISGTVGDVSLSVGDMASPQMPAAVISDTSRLEIEFAVSESEVNYMQAGVTAEVTLKAVSDKTLPGRIASVSGVPDPMKRSYVVKVTMDNPDGVIKSGMFARVSVPTVKQTDAVCIPRSALVAKGTGTVVFVVDEKKRAHERPVTVGIEDDTYAQITKGLKTGEVVITKGNTLVAEGTLVRVVAGGVK